MCTSLDIQFCWPNVKKFIYHFSKLGANSSSSLGEVVPNSRKSTPPSSGKQLRGESPILYLIDLLVF